MPYDADLPEETFDDPGERPRVLATATDFERADRLREDDDRAVEWFEELRARADDLLEEPPVEFEIPDGVRLLSVSRTVVERVQTLGLCYRLTGEERYAERLREDLEAAAAFPDWNPPHFLDTAEMAAAFGIAYDWLHDYWSPSFRADLRDAVVGHALDHAVEGYRGGDPVTDSGKEVRTSWMASEHNWNTVCNGGLSVAALALLGDDDSEATCRAVLQGARDSVSPAIESLAPDGGWMEGIGYWRYNAEYLTYYLSSLSGTLGDDLGIGDEPGVAEAGLFPVYMMGAVGAFTFCDAHLEGRFVRAPELFWHARRFSRPVYGGYRVAGLEAESPLTPMDLLWYSPEDVETLAGVELPRDRHFRGAEDAVTMRSAWEDPDASFLGTKAGDNQVNHGDLDCGSFVYEAAGRQWAVDLPPNDYNVPGYWETGPEGRRWNYYRRRAEGHNLPVIDPDDGPDQDPLAETTVRETSFEPDRAHAVIDLSEAYPGAEVVRGVALTGGRSVALVQDELSLSEPGERWWFLHTEADAEVDGATATLRDDGATLTVRALEPADAAFEVMDAAPLPSSPAPEAEEPVEGVRKLALHATGVTDERVAVAMAPGGEAPEPPIEPLSEW